MTSIYSDIAKRSGGNIYIGVVGPVRTGKSTFIGKFMETAVIPNIKSEYARQRATDELPQSSGGKTIMTIEPKFIPEEAVDISVDDKSHASVKMIDCVGYVIPSAVGYFENEAPRMVKTPWYEDEVPFAMAAETGTRRVITDHSTVAVVVTTDGSITDLPRDEYEECEAQIIDELKKINKPFVVLLNCVSPTTDENISLTEHLSKKYDCAVVPVNCLELTGDNVTEILSNLLYSFPVKEISFNMPRWVCSLDKGNSLKENILSSIRSAAGEVVKIRDVKKLADRLSENENVVSAAVDCCDFGAGTADITVALNDELLYKTISEKTGLDIKNESELMRLILSLSSKKSEYERLEAAFDEAKASGYGIVMPRRDELKLNAPEIVKQNGKYGVKLRAGAKAYHLICTEITTELNPIVASEEQSGELAGFMINDYEQNPDKLWESNIFGKSLYELVCEGLTAKLTRLDADSRTKLGEAIERIVNEGAGGLICFIL